MREITITRGCKAVPIMLLDRADLAALPAGATLETDGLYSFVSWVIRRNARRRDLVSGLFNHAMHSLGNDQVASQSLTFKAQPIDWWARNARIKVWLPTAPDGLAIVDEEVRRQLREPWWRRVYDVWGVAGQFWGKAKEMQIEWIYYCSERVARANRKVDADFPEHASPSVLEAYFKQSPQWKCAGIYEPLLRG